ncbi:M23 family metallopeptidase [Tenacibaculum halocynthiae]|uniref:M23 family metallopeptidase n=1 Tax=Tenacibaculum halocynthiae TaxID=1254437 RepID=UPI0038934739
MKKMLLLLLLSPTLIKAGVNVKIFYEKTDTGYNIYADNHEYCPVSIKINFRVFNLKPSHGINNIYVVGASKKRHLLTKLKILNKFELYMFSFKGWMYYGKYNKSYDMEYVYDLPFNKFSRFRIDQGYNGRFSHKNIYALDFSMPIGTEIRAIRDGVVVKVEEKYSKRCMQEHCKKFSNFIIIYHSDGTFASYAHIKKNGAIVKSGDRISKGELIGYSGDVGYATGAHLHLSVYLEVMGKQETIKTKFRIDNGNRSEYLKDKIFYERKY